MALAGAGSGAGTVSGGATIAVNTITNIVRATIEDATVDASRGGVDVEAMSTSTIGSIAALGSGAGTVSLVGAFSSNRVENVMLAEIGGGAGRDRCGASKRYSHR